jgi:hypothetical protein
MHLSTIITVALPQMLKVTPQVPIKWFRHLITFLNQSLPVNQLPPSVLLMQGTPKDNSLLLHLGDTMTSSPFLTSGLKNETIEWNWFNRPRNKIIVGDTSRN